LSLESVLYPFLVSAAPIFELRGGIPLALFEYDLHWYWAFPICFVGNLLPVPFLLWFLDRAVRILGRVEFFRRLIDWFLERSRRKGKLAERYGWVGLALFVAVPLPVTGAWTGSVVAYLLGIESKRAFLAIALGVFTAGAIVTGFCLAGWEAYLWLKD
jgi:uncharacterized membrane protein